jgi:hypothetical protein
MAMTGEANQPPADGADLATPDTGAAGEAARRTPRQGDQLQPSSKHTPSALAVSERKRADLWKNIAILVCLAALGLTYLSIRAGRATEMIHVMDPLGNTYAGPLEAMSESKKFFNTTAIYATNAALQRSPAGFDLPEVLKLYYSARALNRLEDDLKKRQDDMRRRNLQWKPLIDSISEPVAAGARRIVEVRGRIVIAGAYAGRSFYDEPPFTLVLTFGRNPNLGQAGAYPWICEDPDLKITLTERK